MTKAEQLALEIYYATGDVEISSDDWLKKIQTLLKEREIAEYRQGYNQCLKDQRLTGEKHQRLYL